MNHLSKARAFSDDRLTQLRSSLATVCSPEDVIVTCGSYARRDATASSDLDYFIIGPDVNAAALEPVNKAIVAEIDRIVGKRPSADGAFASNIGEDELLQNYGGSKDSNDAITRRMLFLLEGDYLNNESKFHDLRTQIIARYVDETPLDHQLAFYLLNDLVRYWRTLAVDYADKTYGQANPKPWAIRNAKLVFSRKLIYASGLFAVALTCDRQRDAKVEILNFLFSMPPIDRLRYICGDAATQRAAELYYFFIGKMDDEDVREHLEKLPRENKGTDSIFRSIKNEGHYFSRELFGLFEKTFHSSHPIHMAVVF